MKNKKVRYKNKTLTIRITEKTHNNLMELQKIRNKSQSQIVSELIEDEYKYELLHKDI